MQLDVRAKFLQIDKRFRKACDGEANSCLAVNHTGMIIWTGHNPTNTMEQDSKDQFNFNSFSS